MVRAIKPSPASYYEPGGILNKGGTAPAGGYASATAVASQPAELQRISGLLTQLVGVSSATAQNTEAAAANTAATAKHTEAVKNYEPVRIVRSEHELLRRFDRFVGQLTIDNTTTR